MRNSGLHKLLLFADTHHIITSHRRIFVEMQTWKLSIDLNSPITFAQLVFKDKKLILVSDSSALRGEGSGGSSSSYCIAQRGYIN